MPKNCIPLELNKKRLESNFVRFEMNECKKLYKRC